MKGTVLTLAVFICGCLAGVVGIMDLAGQGNVSGDISMYILYVLMFLVGMSVGSSPDLKRIVKGVNPGILLLPVATIAGSLAFSAVAALLLSGWGVSDCLAVGSGLGYYSLSSVLISQFKEVSHGASMAAELGTVALLSNIFREMFTLLGAPLLGRWFGPFAPVASAGATAFDVCLPAILKSAGDRMLPAAIVSGIVCDVSVPFLVPFFCSF